MIRENVETDSENRVCYTRRKGAQSTQFKVIRENVETDGRTEKWKEGREFKIIVARNK